MLRIFCDLDGVLAKFSQGAIDIHRQHGYVPENYSPKSWDFFEDWGITSSEFWQVIDKDPYFWHSLKPYDHNEELLDLIKGYDSNFKILTSPHDHEYCYAGKFTWMKHHLNINVPKRAIIYSEKFEWCFSEHDILIDDNEENCKLWDEVGGQSILFPAKWNHNRDIEDKVQYVNMCLINAQMVCEGVI